MALLLCGLSCTPCSPTLTRIHSQSQSALDIVQNPIRCIRRCGPGPSYTLLYFQSQSSSEDLLRPFCSSCAAASCPPGPRGHVSPARFKQSVKSSRAACASSQCGRRQHQYGFQFRSLERPGALARQVQSTSDPRLPPSSHCHRLQQSRPHFPPQSNYWRIHRQWLPHIHPLRPTTNRNRHEPRRWLRRQVHGRVHTRVQEAP